MIIMIVNNNNNNTVIIITLKKLITEFIYSLIVIFRLYFKLQSQSLLGYITYHELTVTHI